MRQGSKCAETGATHQEVAEGLAERLGPLEHAVELVVSPPLRRVVADPTLVPVGVERVVERRDFVLAQEVLHHLCSTLRLRGERGATRAAKYKLRPAVWARTR